MPAGATYEPIATNTLASAATSITFSSIPATYTDLRLSITPKASAGAIVLVRLQFNSDTANNYSYTSLMGNGTAASSNRNSNNDTMGMNGSIPANGVGFYTYDIFSYAGSTFKTALYTLSADANGSGDMGSTVGLWRSTAAITTIKIDFLNSAAIGTTATLYGIKAA